MNQSFKKFLVWFWTSVCMIVFISTFNFIYEEKNALIGLSIFLMFLLFSEKDLGLKVKQSIILISAFFFGSAIVSQVASINPIVGFFINFSALLLIMLTFTEQPRDMIYVPFLLMYVFEQSTKTDMFDFLLRIMSFVPTLVLLGVFYYLMHPIKKERNRTLKTVFSHIEIQTERFNLAVKTALTLSSIIVVCSFCPQENARYSVIIALTILQLLGTDIYTANIKNPVRPFLILTVLAVLFYLLVPQEYSQYLFWLFCFVFVYMKRYRIQLLFITISAMGAANIVLDLDTAVPWRIIPLICALIFPVLINRMNFSKFCYHFKDKFFPPNYTISP